MRADTITVLPWFFDVVETKHTDTDSDVARESFGLAAERTTLDARNFNENRQIGNSLASRETSRGDRSIPRGRYTNLERGARTWIAMFDDVRRFVEGCSASGFRTNGYGIALIKVRATLGTINREKSQTRRR